MVYNILMISGQKLYGLSSVDKVLLSHYLKPYDLKTYKNSFNKSN